MLILCIGPDTFRAQEKARELEVAFRQKFDLGGSSMERLSTGKDAVKQVLERSNTASLFSPRRMMRTSDLLLECPKSSHHPLIQALTKDPENIIIISVESERSPETTMKAFANVPKLVKYEFPVQKGADFGKWVADRAMILGYQDEKRVAQLAATCDGDSWLAWNELLKLAAGSTENLRRIVMPKIYDYAEWYVKGGDRRYLFLDGRESESSDVLTVFLSQIRAALRVRDNDTEGLHPFVVKKMQSLAHQKKDLEETMSVILQAYLSQRIGYGSEDEIAAIL